MHLPSLSTSLSLSLAAAVPITATHWNVTLTGGAAATGHRWLDLYSVYSQTPDVTLHCNWIYRADWGNETTKCNSTDFGYGWSGYSWSSNLTLWQSIEVETTGEKSVVKFTGTGPLSYSRCGIGVNGRGCEGSGIIDASV